MSLTFFTVLSVAGVLVLRRKRPDWTRLAPVSFCYPLVPVAYILVGVCMMAYGFIGQPRASLAAFAVVAIGALVYRFAVVEKAARG
jgi:APA family basic amino acid/polyamine antiporter